MHLMGLPERERKGAESVFKEIMVKTKISNLVKSSNLHIQEAQ